jgi:hypothetical protein
VVSDALATEKHLQHHLPLQAVYIFEQKTEKSSITLPTSTQFRMCGWLWTLPITFLLIRGCSSCRSPEGFCGTKCPNTMIYIKVIIQNWVACVMWHTGHSDNFMSFIVVNDFTNTGNGILITSYHWPPISLVILQQMSVILVHCTLAMVLFLQASLIMP